MTRTRWADLPLVEVRGLTKQWGERRGVLDLSFEIAAGQVFGFLGPNGAGKSTTIRLLLGLYLPTRGQVRLCGLDPTRDSVAIHRRVGYLAGELSLYPRLSGREVVERFSRLRGLTSHAYRDHLVQRFGADLDRPIRTLSTGNRQKIGLVLAFMHRPDLVILDEPTSGLDPLVQDEFHALVRETVDDARTVFLSSHELDEVQRLADHVAIIKEGRLILTDTVENIRRSAPRTVEFTFARAVDPRAFDHVPGVRVVRCADGRVGLAVAGSIGPVLRTAAELDPVDMSAKPADLDELFLQYYRSQPSGGERV